MNVLVGYATANGSTRSIAERIASRLGGYGNQVTLLSVEDIDDTAVRAAAAVVVGSAIHGQAWLPEAVRMMREHAAALAERPVWLFSVGMPGALPRVVHGWAMQEGPKVVAGFQDSIRPRGDHLFSGVIRREHLPFIGRLILRLMGGRFGDFRDWPEVDAWTDGIARQLVGHERDLFAR